MFEITGPKASRPPFTGIFRKTLEQSKNDLKQLDAFLINYSLLWKPEFLFAFGLYLQQKNTEYNQSADTKIRNSVVDIYVYIKTKQTQLSLKVFFCTRSFLTYRIHLFTFQSCQRVAHSQQALHITEKGTLSQTVHIKDFSLYWI